MNTTHNISPVYTGRKGNTMKKFNAIVLNVTYRTVCYTHEGTRTVRHNIPFGEDKLHGDHVKVSGGHWLLLDGRKVVADVPADKVYHAGTETNGNINFETYQTVIIKE